METEVINRIFEIFEKDNPHPKTELIYKNHFTFLIAVVLSAQSTDVSVNKATKNLFAKFDTPEKMLILGEEALKNYIKTIGLYNAKAKNIIILCHQLIEQYNSQIPNKFEELIKLAGVGRKTANVILNSIFGQPLIAVDTHVFRVARRIGFSSSDSIITLENELLQRIPKKWLQFAHHWLILHGRYVCKSRKPKCEKCKLQKFCLYYKNQK